MEPNEKKKDNMLSIEDFNTFLNDKQINPNDDKERLFESFLLFQKFMSYMVGKTVNERKDPPNIQEQKSIVSELNEKNINQSIYILNETKLTEETKNNKEVMQMNEKEDINNDNITNTSVCKNIDNALKPMELVIHKPCINHDDIPIKPVTIEFVELVEKNLAELHYQPDMNNDNNEKKGKSNLIKNSRIPSSKRQKLSQSQNIYERKKSENSDRIEKTKSLPRKVQLDKRITEKKEIGSNQIKEEIKDEEEEKPKTLPNFIKEKEDEDSNQMNNIHVISSAANEEHNQKEIQKPFSQSDSLKKIQLPQYDEGISKDNRDKYKSPIKSESDDIIQNCDSDDEKGKKKTEERKKKKMTQKERDKKLLEEINKIKGNVNTIISNPIYHRNSINNNKNKIRKPIEQSNKVSSKELNKQQIDYEEELAKVKELNFTNKQLQKEYQEMKEALQKDIDVFNYKKKKECMEIERIKNEEINKASKLKTSKSFNNQNLLKHQIEYPPASKKDKDEIEQLKNQIAKLQEEGKVKENTFKMTINKIKKQLLEANSEIALLKKANKATLQSNFTSNNTTYRNAISYTNPNMHTNEKKNSTGKSVSNKKPIATKRNFKNENNNIKVIKDDLINETFVMIFPNKYNIGINDVVIKREQLGEGKEMLIYSNDMKEIIFPSGVRKKVFEDGYQIIYFNNNDIKQIFPNGKNVYYFAESKITQTTFPNNLHVYLFPNGQIEKHYPNGTKEIINKANALTTINDPNKSHQAQNNKSNKKSPNEEVVITHKLISNKNSNSLIKIKTLKNKDDSQLYEFI